MTNVLVTGVGGPAGMATIQSLRVAPEKIGIIGVDMNPLAPGLLIADQGETVPACSSPLFIQSLLGLCKKYEVDVIIPTVDEEVSVLAANADAFSSKKISVPIPNAQSVAPARDKYRSSIVQNVGVRSPATVLLKSSTSLEEALETVGLPCVIKRRFGRGGRGFAEIDSRQDLKYWISKSKGEEQILQQRIIGDLLLVQGIARDGEVISSIVHRRLETKSEGSGTAISAVTTKNQAAVDRLRRLAKKLEWTGAMGVEFLLSRSDNELYMIDINPRICGQSHLSTLSGINLAYGLVELAAGREVSLPDRYETDKVFVRVWKDEVFDFSDLKLPRPLI